MSVVDTSPPGRLDRSIRPGRSRSSRRMLAYGVTIAGLGGIALIGVTAVDRAVTDEPTPARVVGGEATDLDRRGIPLWWLPGGGDRDGDRSHEAAGSGS